LPNVTVVKKEISNYDYKAIVGRYLGVEQHTSIHNFPNMCFNSASTQSNKEIVGLRFTYFDDGQFTDIKPKLLEYEGEKEYYLKIREKLHYKMVQNHSDGQDVSSRRIIYNDDSCISLAHFLIREQMFDAKFFVRSSNVKDTLKYDINFIHFLTSQVYQHYHCKQPVKIEVTLNSAHICDRID
jgi:hypothetical protein